MTLLITRNDVMEHSSCEFTAEVSCLDQLRNRKGMPRRIPTTLGNNLDLVATHVERRDGDLCWVDY